MNEQATKQRRPQEAEPAPSRMKPHEYLLAKNWFPLGDPEWPLCPWLPPGFTLVEKYETVTEPMTGEVERYEAGKPLLAEGKIASNPRPAERKQVRVTPKSTALITPFAYRQQLEIDLLEREKAMKAAG